MKILVAISLILGISSIAHTQPCVKKAKEVAPVLSPETAAEYNMLLNDERREYSINPDHLKYIVWYGRRMAYTGQYKKAIEIYTEGLKSNPSAPEIYRHRGHRYITLRCFDDAIKDLEKAASLVKGKPDEIELDGLPNAKNIPTSTLQSNIWYHLGLAYYLKGSFARALKAYEEAQKVSKNNDMRVATSYWHYMTLRRLGKKEEAEKILEPFAGSIELIENHEYLKLIRLNRGEAKAEDLLAEIQGDANTLKSSSLGYGIGNYFLYNGDMEKATTIFRKIVAGNQWASFGFIAAEAEIQRLGAGK